ncbi:hypothetical protein mRhiFer1_009945 [Rhinolophus ferrumequinum]|uniref:Uncharacterized protein n=1 Tax=Rhinolophus ferrumequinum TaxID=59479 RepID=A0A7J7YIP6_RHIFE|nr:hypothetical protein mRhiFer1_009945 [Rhinolophus ferrumequinum]
MAPRTLHAGPAVAQDPAQRRRAPQPGLYCRGREVGRTNHSSSTTWRRRLGLEPRFGGGGCAIRSGARVHRGTGWLAPLCTFARTPAPTPKPELSFWARPAAPFGPSSLVDRHRNPWKTRLPTRTSRSRTYREDLGSVALSLPAPPHSKRRERTGPSRHSQQLREW